MVVFRVTILIKSMVLLNIVALNLFDKYGITYKVYGERPNRVSIGANKSATSFLTEVIYKVNVQPAHTITLSNFYNIYQFVMKLWAKFTDV